MSDFKDDEILIRPNTNAWGPVGFQFRDLIRQPVSDPIDHFTVAAFVGDDLSPEADLSALTNITTLLIPMTGVDANDDNLLEVYFSYPGSAYANMNFMLVFTVYHNASDANKQDYYYLYGRIQGIGG